MPVLPYSPPPVSGIPARCQRLPREIATGYPVPASAFSSREEFQQASAKSKTTHDPVGMDEFAELAWEQKRCGVCSDKLDETCQIVLWNSPKKEAWATPSEPPMHEECLEYSIQVCPVLKGKIVEAETGTTYKAYYAATVPTHLINLTQKIPRAELREIRKLRAGKILALIDSASDPWTEIQVIRKTPAVCPVNHGRSL